MILSYKYKFIFIKHKKVGGTSIEMALSSICGDADIITPIVPKDEVERIKRFNTHCRNYFISGYEDQHQRYVESIKELVKFEDHDILDGRLANIKIFPYSKCQYINHIFLKDVIEKSNVNASNFMLIHICRDPYSQIISRSESLLMDYNKFNQANYQNSDVKKALARSLHNNIEIVKENMLRVKLHSQMQTTVLRYESLQGDFNALLHTLGCQPIDLPYAKKSSRDKNLGIDYFFDKEQIKRVNYELKDYFENFSYPMIEV